MLRRLILYQVLVIVILMMLVVVIAQKGKKYSLKNNKEPNYLNKKVSMIYKCSKIEMIL